MQSSKYNYQLKNVQFMPFSVSGNSYRTYQRRESFSIIFGFRGAAKKMDIVTFDTWGVINYIEHGYQTNSSEIEYSFSYGDGQGDFGSITITNKMAGFAFNFLIIDVPYS